MVYSNAFLANVTVGVKYYIVYEGTLRAIVFNKIALSTESGSTIYHVDVAGIGEKMFVNSNSTAMAISEFPNPKCGKKIVLNIGRMWLTVADYINDKMVNVRKITLADIMENTMPWLEVKGYASSYVESLSVFGYVWNGVGAVREELVLPKTIVIDKEGISINKEVMKAINPLAYFSVEECRKCNHIKVIDFD